MLDYDDPYRILAHHIVGFYRPQEVAKILTESGYILNLIRKEVRDTDFKGGFLDCVIDDIYSKKKRMEYMGHLDMLATYFYASLDRERLRKEIRAALSELGIEL